MSIFIWIYVKREIHLKYGHFGCECEYVDASSIYKKIIGVETVVIEFAMCYLRPSTAIQYLKPHADDTSPTVLTLHPSYPEVFSVSFWERGGEKNTTTLLHSRTSHVMVGSPCFMSFASLHNWGHSPRPDSSHWDVSRNWPLASKNAWDNCMRRSDGQFGLS